MPQKQQIPPKLINTPKNNKYPKINKDLEGNNAPKRNKHPKNEEMTPKFNKYLQNY